MAVLLWGVGISVAALALHLAIWRVRLPRRQSRALALIFAGMLAAGLALALLAGPGPLVPSSWGLARVALLVAVVMCSYILSYPAVEADSPTVAMVMRLMDAGPDGLPVDEFLRDMNDELLVLPRVRDLLRDGLAVLDPADGRYRLSTKGRLMGRLFSTYRGLLGLPLGG